MHGDVQRCPKEQILALGIRTRLKQLLHHLLRMVTRQFTCKSRKGTPRPRAATNTRHRHRALNFLSPIDTP